MPETRYATTADGVAIAYQLDGDGALEIVMMNSAWTSHVELSWEWVLIEHIRRGFAARGRFFYLDRRGTGLSDPVSKEHPPTLEARMDDIRAVIDAVGFERPVLYGFEDATAQCFLFAASYPERVRAIIAGNPTSRGRWAPESPWLWTDDQWAEELAAIERAWGTPGFVQAQAEGLMPEFARDPVFVRTYGRILRNSMSRADALVSDKMWRDTDVRHVLPLIQAPTLVFHHAHIHSEAVEEARYVARHIPGARFVELERADVSWAELFAHLDPFLASLRAQEREFDRTLATVLFTDIVGSTEKSAELGDAAWKSLLEEHNSTVRAMIGRYQGREIKTMGDGFLATFDGPARGVRCAQAIVEGTRVLGIEVRAGLHTGEVTLDGDDVAGLGVVIGARVGATAGPSEVLASQTVKDLVAGSGLFFEDAGEHELKGVPDRWHLYRVVG
jgi:class 3 adenylate cyclase/pimeloyl-ACP methyl ester carboxylesterase